MLDPARLSLRLTQFIEPGRCASAARQGEGREAYAPGLLGRDDGLGPVCATVYRHPVYSNRRAPCVPGSPAL